MGRNDDEDSADSNGSGKTTLCMAALWALTGSSDVRLAVCLLSLCACQETSDILRGRVLCTYGKQERGNSALAQSRFARAYVHTNVYTTTHIYFCVYVHGLIYSQIRLPDACVRACVRACICIALRNRQFGTWHHAESARQLI